MSHIVTIKTQVRDLISIQSACQRLGLAPANFGKAQLFTTEASGWQVQLPGWKYPIVCQTDRGEIQFDNFDGAWGETAELHRFLQAYAVERTKQEARRQGHDVSEQLLADGSIRVHVAMAS
jgi:hypothetical protein